MDQQTIEAACSAHGAGAVYAAAYSAMSGHRAKLVSVGLGDVHGPTELNRVCSVAFGLLTDKDRTRILRRYSFGNP